MARQRSRVRPHPFIADPEMPPDQRNRHTCATCNLVGLPGDVHHPTTPPPLPARPLKPAVAEAARERDARVLGEHRDD